MGTKNQDKRKAKKAKKRQERIRQEKHARQLSGGAGTGMIDPALSGDLDWPEETWGDDEVDDDQVEDRPVSMDFTLERIQRTIAWVTKRRSFANRAELESFVSEHLNGDAWRKPHAEMLAASVQERAQELAFQALEADGEDESLAQQALDLDPDCLDAARVRSNQTMRLEQQFEHLHQMLQRYGQRPLVMEAIASQDGKAWPRVVARPYIRTVMALADIAGHGEDYAAASGFAELVQTLAADQYGSYRDKHLGWLLADGQRAEARELLDRYPDDQGVVWLWGRALERFLAGDRSGARIAVDEARQIVGAEFEGMVIDGPDEPLTLLDAVLFDTIGQAWMEDEDALDWLSLGCCLTTVDQQKQAKESYRPPVSGLLALGAPKAERDSIVKMMQRAKLTPFDVPELLRMADDQALNELSADDPAVYGPVHAIQAIGEFHPPTALPALIAMLPRRINEDWMESGLVQAFREIGQAAIAPLRAILVDQNRRPTERGFAADTLAHVAEQHPDSRDEVVGILVHVLRGYQVLPKQVNGYLGWGLSRLRAVEVADLVKAVYDAGRMDVDMCGSWESYVEYLTREDDLA